MSSPLLSISISDDDSDDLAGKLRVRLRRKRKKHGEGRLIRRIFTVSRRWWPVLLFLPAIALLLFESSNLSMKPLGEETFALLNPKPVMVEIVDPKLDDEMVDLKPVKESPPGNLDRLDPVMKVIGGLKQPCLKLLSPEEIHKLEFPESAEPNSPIKRVVYRSDSGNYLPGDNVALLMQNAEATRFNLFTGFQTLQEREESFKANETAVVHCGFYSGNVGFKISDNDQSYMQTCKAVVSTCAFGGGDDLYQPIGMTEDSLEKVCYVAFWDEITRSAQEAEGVKINEEHMIGKWRIVLVKDLPFSDQRLNGKIPKMLCHRLFPQARYSIWVDSKSQFRRDPLGVLEALLWRTGSILAISEHGARSSLYDEAKGVVQKNKATPEEVEVQLNQYRRDGIPDDKTFNGKKALAEASIIVREHTPLTNLFTCVWFNEVVRFTSRDQLSFPYVLRRLKMPGINMFTVCNRRDLVNSMGHKRKVKPLAKSIS